MATRSSAEENSPPRTSRRRGSRRTNSIWLSHDALGRGVVGHEPAWKTCELSLGLTRDLRGTVVQDDVEAQVERGDDIDLVQELDELLRAVAILGLVDDLTGVHVQRREQTRGVVTPVFKLLALRVPERTGLVGFFLDFACIWDFSSTDSTNAVSAGSR